MCPLGVEPGDVGIDRCGQCLDGEERGVAVELVLQMPEETLHHGIVEAIAPARHRLDRSAVQELSPGSVLILKALIGVHDGFLV